MPWQAVKNTVGESVTIQTTANVQWQDVLQLSFSNSIH